ncbi:hypothetical protein QBC38DRAFT_472518 [Podospora fimiseda]|uniref:Uncharacterized protein n=1 Tax=Podospora fimiseda TaxID=252190 RepID=A0AAN7BU32_9PEZI|nr:hypothetical protein QBC38DRAFT_472518 [Podospora fimiseda]
MVMLLFFRMYLQRNPPDEPAQTQIERTDLIMDRDESEQEKQQNCQKSRNWPLIILTIIRTCQLIFSGFSYFVFYALIESGTYWLDDPKDKATYDANVPWVRMLNCVNLVYHISALALLHFWKRTEAKKWRYFAISTFIGDLLSLWAFLYVLSLMYTTYQGYCYNYPRVFDYEKDGFLTYFGKGMPKSLYWELQLERYITCAFLDGFYWLSLIPSLSHLLSSIITAWYYSRIKRIEGSSCSRFCSGTFEQKVGDLEQAVLPPAVVSARESTPPPSPLSPHSPPPSYRSRSGSTATTATKGRPPSYRRISMETASSVDPDTFLVSDGWRGPDQQPPEYSSRPPSVRKEQP